MKPATGELRTLWFMGAKTRRFGALLARSETSRLLAVDATVLAVAEAVLGP